MDLGGNRPKFARLKKRLKDANGIPIGVAIENLILDSRMYEVEYCDGYVAAMAANIIDENLFTKVDQEGNRFVLINSIINTRTDGMQTLHKDVFIITNSGTKQRKIQQKDGKYASNGMVEVLNGTNTNISRTCIQYK